MKKINRYRLITLLLSLMCLAAQAQTTGNFTDSRDGQTYKTISIENVLMGSSTTWMAQNLNYKVPGSYAYDNNENFRKGIGLLYTWEAAKKACPSGWHLPSDGEWSILANEFGGMDKAGEALKNDKGWNDGGNGTNSSGFSALPAGYRDRDGGFAGLGKVAYWWSATPVFETSAANGEGASEFLQLNYDNSEVGGFAYRGFGTVSDGYSVRCVRD